MLILHVNIHVKPEFLESFRAATIENANNSRQEPGIARFDFVEHSDDPQRFSLWEVYRSDEAVAQHKLTAHYAVWTASVEKMMAEPRTRTWYKSVYPADGGW